MRVLVTLGLAFGLLGLVSLNYQGAAWSEVDPIEAARLIGGQDGPPFPQRCIDWSAVTCTLTKGNNCTAIGCLRPDPKGSLRNQIWSVASQCFDPINDMPPQCPSWIANQTQPCVGG